MGMLLLLGAMTLTAGLWRSLLRASDWSSGTGPRNGGHRVQRDAARGVVVPDRVPTEWVDAYRTEQDG
jgi:hypothetical protein